ncbi:hypothetical protein LVJ94_40645 [Pendulispora rubella]|uniref:Roadblock/LAMTOR2 domain-containing protein n=1 Tax=Pendulispora rubella TaxID=2741070 RepID=A0ABZ2KWZ5_9BACT
MIDRRSKRSTQKNEAFQYLLEAVADRSEVEAVALVDTRGNIVAGTGLPQDLAGIARVAGPVARGEECVEFDLVTATSDLFLRSVPAGDESLYLVALGSRVRKMNDAANAITRIATGA